MNDRPYPRKTFRSQDGRIRIVVAGSRGFNDYTLMKKKMEEITMDMRDPIIVTGGAKGADQMAMKWAGYYWYLCHVHYPDWDKFGKKAGILRNLEMLKHGDMLVAFWDGESPGTRHIIQAARKREMTVKVIPFAPIKLKPRIRIIKQ